MEFIKAKTILSKVTYGNHWFGIDYNMNLYRGCSHGCIYCDSRNDCYNIENFDVVKSKENGLTILEKELIRKKEGVIGIGSMSDTYNPLERKYEITKRALELIYSYNYGVSIDTKSDLILRDLEILKKINMKNNVIVKFTITTFDDKLSSIIEPRVCPSSSRFKAVKKLSDAGIFVGIMINPVLPYITDNVNNIRTLVKLAHQNGAKFITTYMSLTLKANQRTYYYQMLDKYFYGLKGKYVKNYGNSYNCLAPNYRMLYKVFTEECCKYGILYDMDKIIKAYKKDFKKNEQLKLF